jgi:hypothetical protein
MGGFLGAFKGLIGGDPVKAVGDLIDQFHLSPEQKAQLQQATQQLELQREQMTDARDEALASIREQDVDSARKRQAAVKDWVPSLLAIGVTLGFFGILAALVFRDIPQTGQQVLYAMVGSLGTAWIAIIGYYFGSSAGEGTKTDILGELVKKQK